MGSAHISRREALLAGFGGLCLCCLPMAGFAADAFTMQEVAPGLYVRRGVDEDATAQNRDAIANIGFIVGDDAVLVTDAGGSLVDGQWLRAQIKAKTDKPIKYVVMSHVHPDHMFGAGAFVDDDPTFVGHAKLPAALDARGKYYEAKLAEIIGVGKVGPIVKPSRTIADSARIDLGGRVVALRAHGPAHTTSDLSMLDEKSGMLLPADLLFVDRVPSIDGSLLGWLRELETLSTMGAKRAVPGHGPVVVDFDLAAAALRDYLVELRDGVRREIKGNGSIETAIRTVGQNQAPKWKLFADYNGRNVTEAYKELEWE